MLRTQTGIGVSNSGGPGKSTAVRIRGEDSFRTLLMSTVSERSTRAPRKSCRPSTACSRPVIFSGSRFCAGRKASCTARMRAASSTSSRSTVATSLGGQLGLEYGDYSTRKIDGALSGGGEGGDYFLSVVDLETDGFNSRTADTVLQDDDGAENTTLHAKFGWNWSENVRLEFVARDIDAETEYDSCFVVHDCLGTARNRRHIRCPPRTRQQRIERLRLQQRRHHARRLRRWHAGVRN